MANLEQCLCPEHDTPLNHCFQCDDTGQCDQCEYCWTCETSGLPQPKEMLRQRIARAKGLVQAADLVKSLLASVPDEQRKTLTGIALIAGLQLALNAIKEEAEETLEQCLAYATHCGADSESDFRESLRALREDEEKN